MGLDPSVEAELTRAALDVGISFIRGAVARREGRQIEELDKGRAIAAIRAAEAGRTFETTDELVSRGAAQAGAGEVDDG